MKDTVNLADLIGPDKLHKSDNTFLLTSHLKYFWPSLKC